MADGTYRKRAVTYPGTTQPDLEYLEQHNPPRPRSNTESNITQPMARKTKPIYERRRSLSDPPRGGVSKFLHWGLG